MSKPDLILASLAGSKQYLDKTCFIMLSLICAAGVDISVCHETLELAHPSAGWSPNSRFPSTSLATASCPSG